MTEPDDHPESNSEENKSTVGPSGPDTPDGSDGDEKLRALAADYEARIDEVTELITRVRHEINNPLTGVLGQAQLLLREELSESALKRVQTIEKLAMRLNDIVGQLR